MREKLKTLPLVQLREMAKAQGFKGDQHPEKGGDHRQAVRT